MINKNSSPNRHVNKSEMNATTPNESKLLYTKFLTKYKLNNINCFHFKLRKITIKIKKNKLQNINI